MSEPISVGLEIGGGLPASLINTFLTCINNDIDRGEGLLTIKDITNLEESLTVYGTANYGLVERTHKFCIEHNLPFIVRSEASGEYNADTTFFVPGMEDSENYATDQNDNAVVRSNQVRPMFDLLLALVDRDIKALPKFLNNPAVADLIRDCLESPDEIVSHLREQINELLPREAPDTLPPLTIDESR